MGILQLNFVLSSSQKWGHHKWSQLITFNIRILKRLSNLNCLKFKSYLEEMLNKRVVTFPINSQPAVASGHTSSYLKVSIRKSVGNLEAEESGNLANLLIAASSGVRTHKYILKGTICWES